VTAGTTQQVNSTYVVLGTLNPNAPNVGQFGQIDAAAFVGGPVRGTDSAADRTGTIALRITIENSAATAQLRTRQQSFVVRRI
jgi:hypothetical protein